MYLDGKTHLPVEVQQTIRQLLVSEEGGFSSLAMFFATLIQTPKGLRCLTRLFDRHILFSHPSRPNPLYHDGCVRLQRIVSPYFTAIASGSLLHVHGQTDRRDAERGAS